MIEVNNVSYYNGNECFDNIRSLLGDEGTIMWCLGTVKKYLFRAGNKKDNPAEVDIEKAGWYFHQATQIMNELGNSCSYETSLVYTKVKEELYSYV